MNLVSLAKLPLSCAAITVTILLNFQFQTLKKNGLYRYEISNFSRLVIIIGVHQY